MTDDPNYTIAAVGIGSHNVNQHELVSAAADGRRC